MKATTTLGGMPREPLFRVWFLFYIWALAGSCFAPGANWPWFAWLGGASITCWLIYRRSMLAGIAGFFTCGSAVAATLPDAAAILGLGSLSPATVDAILSHVRYTVVFRLYLLGMPLVPLIVLAEHIASRHRILRQFEQSVAEHRHDGRVIPPSGYYLITRR